MARTPRPKVTTRKATYLVLNLTGKTQALVEGPFRNTFDTMKEAKEHAGTVAEKYGGLIYIVQLLDVVRRSTGSCQAREVTDDTPSPAGKG